MKKLFLAVALLTSSALAQTTVTITGTIRDLSNALVTSGKVTFTLRPSSDATISGLARFTPSTITCLINGSGLVKAQDGTSACILTMNSALQPTGSYYQVAIWPFNVKTSSFNFYAINSSYDITTIVPTPTTSPADNFVDIFSTQTIGGSKTFSSAVSFPGGISGATSFTGNETFSGTNLHTGTETFTGLLQCKSLPGVRCVDSANSQSWAGSDLGAWVAAAQASLGGTGQIAIAPGTYTLTTPIAPATGQQFLCAGIGACTINATALSAGQHVFSNTSAITGVRISGFTLNGPTGSAAGGTLQDSRGISLDQCTRCEVDHNRITSFFFAIAMANFAGTADQSIHDNWLSNLGGFGISSSGTGVQIRHNRIDTVGTSSNLHQAIYVQQSEGALVDGNIITNVQSFCVQLSLQSTGVSGINARIVNNYCKNTGLAPSGLRGGIVLSVVSPATSIDSVVIAHNTIDTVNGGVPIVVSSSSGVSVDDNTIRTYQNDGIVVQALTGFTTERVSVTNNKLFGDTVAGNAIRMTVSTGTAARNLTVSDNIVDGVFGQCIILDGVTDSDVHDNRCKDWNIQGVSGNAGIGIQNASLRNNVHDNILTTANCTGSPTSILVVDATNLDNKVTGNMTTGACGGVSDAGVRTQKWGNHTQTSTGSFEILGGIGADFSGFKHKRAVTGCATGAAVGAACTTTFTWSTAFPDTNYTPSCMGDGVSSGVPVGGGITAKTAASVTFQTVATTAAAAQYTNIECLAAHD